MSYDHDPETALSDMQPAYFSQNIDHATRGLLTSAIDQVDLLYGTDHSRDARVLDEFFSELLGEVTVEVHANTFEIRNPGEADDQTDSGGLVSVTIHSGAGILIAGGGHQLGSDEERALFGNVEAALGDQPDPERAHWFKRAFSATRIAMSPDVGDEQIRGMATELLDNVPSAEIVNESTLHRVEDVTFNNDVALTAEWLDADDDYMQRFPGSVRSIWLTVPYGKDDSLEYRYEALPDGHERLTVNKTSDINMTKADTTKPHTTTSLSGMTIEVYAPREILQRIAASDEADRLGISTPTNGTINSFATQLLTALNSQPPEQ